MTGKEYLQHYNIQPTEERVIIVEHLKALKRGASFDLPEGCRVDTTDYILSGICQECEKSISDK